MESANQNPVALFDILPDYSVQGELLSLKPVPVDIDSEVENPVAKVYLNLPFAHLSQLFDYEIPLRFADLAIGARVKVELGNRKVEGFVVARTKTTASAGKLRPIYNVISNISVLQPQILDLLQRLATCFTAPIADLFRLAIPQRHARAEKEFFALAPAQPVKAEVISSFVEPEDYENAEELISGKIESLNPVTLIHCLPQHDLEIFVRLIQRVLETDGSVLILVPTPRDVAKFSAKLAGIFPLTAISKWTSEHNHAARYAQFLSALEARTRIIIGTRNAIWAPLQKLQLIIQFDEAHSAYQERRSPYLNSRDVLLLRSQIEKAKYCIASYGPSLDGFHLIWQQSQEASCLHSDDSARQIVSKDLITAITAARKHKVPQLLGANQFKYDDFPWSRMPSSLFRIVRAGLLHGAVLIAVPKAGYILKLACVKCNTHAICEKCGAGLQIPAPNASVQCMRCGFITKNYSCPNCAGTKLKSTRIGSERTALEIGRAFPGVSINIAGSNSDNTGVKSGQIVIATIGSEPVCQDGYSAAVVLDCGYLLASSGLEAEAMFLRAVGKIMRLVKVRDQGGKVLLVGNVPTNLINVPGRWDFPQWEAETYRERVKLGLPPAKCWFSITGEYHSLRKFLGLLKAETADFISGCKQKNPGNKEQTFNRIDDPLGEGGVHTILPAARILGPHTNADGLLQIFLQPDSAFLAEYEAALNRVNRLISINRNTVQIRIRRNPPL